PGLVHLRSGLRLGVSGRRRLGVSGRRRLGGGAATAPGVAGSRTLVVPGLGVTLDDGLVVPVIGLLRFRGLLGLGGLLRLLGLGGLLRLLGLGGLLRLLGLGGLLRLLGFGDRAAVLPDR